MMVAKIRCHVVRKIGKSVCRQLACRRLRLLYARNLAVSRMYLLKTMVLELRVIQVLRNSQRLHAMSRASASGWTYAMYTAGWNEAGSGAALTASGLTVGSTGWAGSRAASTEDRIFSSEDMAVVECGSGRDGRRG
jgi:hypothetical protein